QIVLIRPKARHNALSHSGAIAVIAPDRLVTAIVTAIGALQPSHRSARCTNSAVIAPDLDSRTKHSAYSGVGSIGLTRTSLPPNHRSSKYVRVLQVGTLKYLEKIISISFSHLLNTNTSPASNSSLIASFRLSRHLEQIRPIDSLQRSSQRSARYTYSGHSTRLISAQGSRHIDRRAVPIAVIALDQSQIVRLIHNVKVFLQITYLPSVTYSHVIVL
ncbi:hypothetical protein L249_7078, partial [Ophiocordyceps polyrhachis-furcata BCC 54312]